MLHSTKKSEGVSGCPSDVLAMLSKSDLRSMHVEFLKRDNFMSHHKYSDAMLHYVYIKNGDPRSIDILKHIYSIGKLGKLSDDPLRSSQYNFACAMAVTTRFVIEGGMDTETAYNLSDLYIQRADICKSADEVMALHFDMAEFMTMQMSRLKKRNVYSKPIVLCMDYIGGHLNQIIRVDELAKEIGITPNYLSALFKKEIGMPISEYIRRRRVEAAENMLMYSEFTLMEISQYLAFSSYSHFAEVFRKHTEVTPNEYRKKYFRNTGIILTERDDELEPPGDPQK